MIVSPCGGGELILEGALVFFPFSEKFRKGGGICAYVLRYRSVVLQDRRSAQPGAFFWSRLISQHFRSRLAVLLFDRFIYRKSSKYCNELYFRMLAFLGLSRCFIARYFQSKAGIRPVFLF